MVEVHISKLQSFLGVEQTFVHRDVVLTNDQAHAALIAGLLIKPGGAKLDKQSADALTEDYLDAIEDLPAWAVREALRKWNRRESLQIDKKAHDFNWKPTPPTLRSLAYLELWTVKCEIKRMQDIAGAVPRLEFSDDHREDIIKRLQAVQYRPREAAE